MRRLTLLALVALAAGCGGSSGPSKKDFSARADAICQDTKNAAYGISYGDVPPASPDASTADLRRYAAGIDKAVALFAGEVAKLRQLEPPKDFRQGFVQWLDALTARVARLRHAAAAGRKGDRQTLIVDLQKTGLNTRALSIASVYGLESCGAAQ